MRFIFTVTSISAVIVEDGVFAAVALDSAIVASNGRSLCNQFLHLYVIFIGSGIMHAFSVFLIMSLFCASVTVSRMPNDAKPISK